MSKGPAITPNAFNLLAIAADAAQQIKTPYLMGGNPDALVPVVFAASSLEAFINESGEWASQLCDWTLPQPQIAHAFAAVLADAEESRSSVISKYQLASWVLFGKSYQKGTQPFQDFALLMELRNSIVHLKGSSSVLRKLQPKGILSEDEGENSISEVAGGWIYRIKTKAVADWACATASAVVCDFFDRLPAEMCANVFTDHVAERRRWAEWRDTGEKLF